MANFKGKLVEVAFYDIAEAKPKTIVKGKVTYIHTAQGIRDTSTIRLADKNGKDITPQHYYFVILGEVKELN